MLQQIIWLSSAKLESVPLNPLMNCVVVEFQRKLPLNKWFCGFLWWCVYSLYLCSSWSYVWISLDRFIAIWMSNWYRIHGKKEKMKKPLFLITAIMFVIMSPNLIFRETIKPEGSDVHSKQNNLLVLFYSKRLRQRKD